MKTVICARDARDADVIRGHLGLKPQEAPFIRTEQDLRGLGDFNVVFTERFLERRDAQDLLILVRFLQRRGRT